MKNGTLRQFAALIGSLALGVGMACAGQASGTVTVEAVGTISPTHAVAYVVRNSRNARTTRVEILLSGFPLDAAEVHAALDPHLSAINLEGLNGRDYVLLWVEADGTVTMNATFGRTMTQMLNDTNGGLAAELAANTPARVEGRVFSPQPVRTLGGTIYSVDLKFAADVPAPIAGSPLPAGGGDPGKAFTGLLAAVAKRNWPGIRAASSPAALKMFEASYNTPGENAATAADLLRAWLPARKLKVSGGQRRGDIAILDVEGEIFEGQRGLSVVQMVKTGAVWQFERAARVGMLP